MNKTEGKLRCVKCSQGTRRKNCFGAELDPKISTNKLLTKSYGGCAIRDYDCGLGKHNPLNYQVNIENLFLGYGGACLRTGLIDPIACLSGPCFAVL